ncbi:MAG: lipoyl(octanoyl) transferase LipB [Actinomycetota bacterium]
MLLLRRTASLKPALQQVHAATVPYALAYEWQRTLHARRVAGEIPDLLLTLEHPHVFSLGRRFDPSHLLAGEHELAARGIEMHEADRGGSITYHGPGQLVGYPIVDLRATPEVTADPIAYLRVLERAIIHGCAQLGVAAGTREGLTGVWVGREKLAAIGVNVSRGVAKHGFALNVTTDLDFFSSMVPCGIEEAAVTSLEALLGAAIPVRRAAEVLGVSLADHLSRRLVTGSLEDLTSALGWDSSCDRWGQPIRA